MRPALRERYEGNRDTGGAEITWQQLAAIFRARWRAALLVLLATVAIGTGWVLLRPPKFTARVPILVDVRSDPVNAVPWHRMLAPSFVVTQVDIMRSDRVLRRAGQILSKDPAFVASWRDEETNELPSPDAIAGRVRVGLDVKPPRDSNVIHIAWTGSTPAEAARVANALAQAYLETDLEIRTDPAREDTVWLAGQVKDARTRLETAQQKLAEYQRQAGIIGADERSDFETQRLNEILRQSSAAQGRGVGSPGAASDASPLVNNLREEIAKVEAKLGQASATMGSQHPEMLRMQSELGALRARLRAESGRVGAAAAQSADASRARQRELEAAISDQKARVLSQGRGRGELNVLKADVDSAQKAFDAVSETAAQAGLRSMSTQSTTTRLAPAVEPIERNGLTTPEAILISLALGSILALACALLLELASRRVRSSRDLSAIASLQVLAAVPADRNRRPGLGLRESGASGHMFQPRGRN